MFDQKTQSHRFDHVIKLTIKGESYTLVGDGYEDIKSKAIAFSDSVGEILDYDQKISVKDEMIKKLISKIADMELDKLNQH